MNSNLSAGKSCSEIVGQDIPGFITEVLLRGVLDSPLRIISLRAARLEEKPEKH